MSQRAVFGVATGLLMLANLYLIFMVAPTDAAQGEVARIIYLHVPIAIMSFLAFFFVFVGSIVYLIKRDQRWDSLAHSAGEVGVVFISVALLTGMIWARPVWNTWWVWEPRLTTTLVLWLIYVAYLMVRAYAPNRARAGVYAAVVGIIGFVDVPIVYFAVEWWGSLLHPDQVIGPWAESGSLDRMVYTVLLVSFLAFLLLLVYMVMERMSLRDSEDELGRIRFTMRRAGRSPARQGTP